MDVLTHIFLPLTLLFVVKRDLFESHPAVYLLALFAVLPDLDKFFGVPGLLHSLVTLIPIVLGVFLIERSISKSNRYFPVIAFFIFSHLLLDFLEGGPVPLLYPFEKAGVGLIYPIEIVFGEGALGATVRGSVEVVKRVPEAGFHAYEGLVSGFGVASLFLFGVIFLQGLRRSETENESETANSPKRGPMTLNPRWPRLSTGGGPCRPPDYHFCRVETVASGSHQ